MTGVFNPSDVLVDLFVELLMGNETDPRVMSPPLHPMKEKAAATIKEDPMH